MVFFSKDSTRTRLQIKIPSESFLFPVDAQPVDEIFNGEGLQRLALNRILGPGLFTQ